MKSWQFAGLIVNVKPARKSRLPPPLLLGPTHGWVAFAGLRPAGGSPRPLSDAHVWSREPRLPGRSPV